ncbi:hypothetical protein EVAR_15819_1 [Eumeta japonica]|uniref:Uncharacterized protein n=1 Tax=Eumeta variegata TaxID=151549 RepID=A0A4C1TZJ1_EUMVA|nr:hypothetical protein EVAR_15819_1 [Eumeta japonica]
MVNIIPCHQAYWGLAKALKREEYVPALALRKSDNSVAFDDWEKVKCLTDSIDQQRSDNPPYDLEYTHRVEEERLHWPMGVPRVGAPRRCEGLRELSTPLRLVQMFLVDMRHRVFNFKSTSKQREPSQHFWCATVHNRCAMVLNMHACVHMCL